MTETLRRRHLRKVIWYWYTTISSSNILGSLEHIGLGHMRSPMLQK
jgi:hypothetical protein